MNLDRKCQPWSIKLDFVSCAKAAVSCELCAVGKLYAVWLKQL